MDSNDNNLNNNEKIYHNEPDEKYEDYTPQIPEAVDRRAPQLNEANSSCHCSCPCARGGSDGDGAAVDASSTMDRDMNQEVNHDHGIASSDTSSDCGDEAMEHDEGVEEHMIEVGDFGYHSLDLIHRTLARHKRCTCHGCGILPADDDYPFNSMASSGFLAPEDSMSMIVETSSGDQSMASSRVLSMTSRGSSLLAAMGGPFDQVHIFSPLPLTPEIPIDIDLAGSDFHEFDM